MKKLRKFLSAGLILAMTASLLSACSGGSSNDDSKSAADGKGRYVEEDYGLPGGNGEEGSYSYIQTIRQLSDGTLRVWLSDDSEQGFSIMDSTDGGKTWTESSMDMSGLSALTLGYSEEASGYINNPAMDENGNMAFAYVSSTTTTEGTTHKTESVSTYYLLTADGKLNEIPMEIPDVSKTETYEWNEAESDDTGEDDGTAEGGDTAAAESGAAGETEDDGIIINEGGDSGEDDYASYNGIQTFKLLNAETLYVLDYNGTIYQINTADGQIVNTISDLDWVNDMYLCGDRLLVFNYQTLAEYDTETGKKKSEHEELVELLTNARGNIAIADYIKDGNTIYYACSDGIFTYNLDDGSNEQLVDGNMSSLVSPNSSVSTLIPKDDGDILVRFSDYSNDGSGETLLNYSYDAEAAKRPDKELTVYTLQDDYNVRNLAAMFQKANPDIYINVESGMSSNNDNAITSSDAIRTLNTEIMAGEGPDIIFLDGLPVDSYIEKGLLADISDVAGTMIDEGKLFKNIATTYETDDGKLYAIPANFSIPIVVGHKDLLDQLNSLSDLATLADQFAADSKGGQSFIDTYGLISLLGDMMPVNAASWFNADGSLNAENLKAYLQDIKTVYDSVYDNLSDADKESVDSMLTYYRDEDTQLDASWYGTMDPSSNVIYILAGQQAITYGAMAWHDSLQNITSAMRQDSAITYKQLPGALQNVYIPDSILGINSKSADMESAKKFLSYALSSEGQKALGDYSGYSVNIERFDASMVDPNADQPGYDPNVSTGGWGFSDEDGNEYMLDMYWPKDEQIADFKAMIETLETPSYNDNMILSTILNDCFDCITGDESIDAAVEQVIKDINIYLSE